MFLSTVIYGFTWSSVLYMYQMCQGGDFLRGNGFGSESIYGQFMRDEKFIYTHSKRGVLSMASTRRKHTNSCQFFITFAPCPWLDGRHVVLGHVISGWQALSAIEDQGTEAGFLRRPCEIFNCGEIIPGTFDVLETQNCLPYETKSQIEGNTAALHPYNPDMHHQPPRSLSSTADVKLSSADTNRPTRVVVPQDKDHFYIPDAVYKRNKYL
eukprot:GHVQ01000467.1.p1 GENE.GHVQ01000467.1~~GHVQ01000467.1.p1  ORF type:complete len:211 (+),score=15.47 GHVQ01000467.1:204-836(+)